jgi:hypothetical protein
VIVIEPTNPQIVYVPQYNTEVVYTQAPTQVIVVEDDNTDEAIAAGLIGFTAGIAIGAAMDNNYYYGPYGWHGGAYMYNDAWDDYYDHREDAREDWMDHREDVMKTGRSCGDRRNSGPSAPARPRSSARTVKRHGRKRARRRRRNERSGARRRKALRPRDRHKARRPRARRRVAQAVPKPAATAAEARLRQRLSETAARTHFPDIRAEDRNARPALVDNRAAAARAGAEAGAAAGERREEVNTHDGDHAFTCALLIIGNLAAQTATSVCGA